jgi:hypothetical protein
MSLLELIVAALGGGIVATLLGGWVRWLRAFRLLAIHDLEELIVTSKVLDETEPIGYAAGLRWATFAWEHHREALTLGLQTRDRRLLDDLSTLLAAAAVFRDSGTQMFTPEQREQMESARTRLSELHLRWYEVSFVYGVRYGVRAAKQRRLLARAEESGTRTS